MSILSDLNLVVLGCVAIILYCTGGAIYRLYFSPIARFPGPKFAAATLWYEFYYDVVKQGQYTFKIKELHDKYGPIIRISPYELHINDPGYYEVLYSWTSPRNKYKFYTDQFGNGDSGFGSVSHELHRVRRQAIAPFFSRASILRLETIISSLVEKLCSRIEGLRASGEPANMRWVYMCYTTDVITSYAMNRSWNHLESPDFAPLWYETIKGTAESGVVMKQFPWLFPVIRSIPALILGYFSPGMKLLLDFQEKIKIQIEEIVSERDADAQTKENGVPQTIFHELLSSELSEKDKSVAYLAQEGQTVVGAGADTTANTIAITHFHLLNNPAKLKKLKAELEAALPNKYEPVKLVTVEKLPYLSAVIQEGLRLSNSVSSRLQRIAPNEVLKFHDWKIPAGTPIGMTSFLIHHDESIFPDSHAFIPERWTEASDGGRSLDRYLVPFSKGSRQCIGLNLAKAEIFLAIATVFRRFDDMELFDTHFDRDVDMKHEMFLPQPSRQSKGIRVIFK